MGCTQAIAASTGPQVAHRREVAPGERPVKARVGLEHVCLGVVGHGASGGDSCHEFAPRHLRGRGGVARHAGSALCPAEDARESNPPAPSPATPLERPGLERDPVCGMRVDPAKARWKTEHQGKVYYFCNERCLTKFSADPARYLAPPPASAAGGAGPGSHAPAPTASQAAVEYTCPMHPEVAQRRARGLPDLRHGARAAAVAADDDAEPRARRHDAGGSGSRSSSTAPAASSWRWRRCSARQPLGRAGAARCLGRARARDAGRPLGRLAVLRARLAIGP